jgi:hypothetical protein
MAVPEQPTTLAAIMGFLREHAGKEFCTGCLSRLLFNGREIDVAMRHIEARGVIRHHGRCSECGKPRLVAGVNADGDADPKDPN